MCFRAEKESVQVQKYSQFFKSQKRKAICNFCDQIELNLSLSFFKLNCLHRPFFCQKKGKSCAKQRQAQAVLHKKEKHKGKKTLRAYCDLAYREEGKEKSIIAAGPLRVAAVIAGI